MKHTELTKIREEKKLTKTELGKLIGITAMMVGRYESGKIAIPDDVAEKVLSLIEDKAEESNEPKTTETEKTKADVTNELKAEEVEAPVAEVKEEKKAEKAPAKKTSKKKTAIKTATAFFIQALSGSTITPEEILDRIPAGADAVYVKPDENKAYWVKGEELGNVDLW